MLINICIADDNNRNINMIKNSTEENVGGVMDAYYYLLIDINRLAEDKIAKPCHLQTNVSITAGFCVTLFYLK